MDDVAANGALTGSEIAIIGMSLRLPGANTPEAFWQNLCNGVESIVSLGDEELRAQGVEEADFNHPNYVKAAAPLDQIDCFDAAFFGYTPPEAEVMDPQHRILLECAWEALEHAGYDPARYSDMIGVYVGAKTSTYILPLLADPARFKALDPLQVVLGNDMSLLGTRLSYKLDLKGPSYNVQTACSTSLVAVHLACQSLLIDECQMALAGGIALNIPDKVGYRYEEDGIVSPDGHCRPFDAAAQGTVFGNGVGLVVLKRLEDALADGDSIYAVIKGSATNNDGAVKASFTAPSVEGQTNVIIDALAAAGVSADSISYVEAHATGTRLGDPIEALALSNAYQVSTQRQGFCGLGSVKSNIGHLDAAAGIAGLLKTVLALQHQAIPPSLHCTTPNPRIDWASSPFFVATELRPWPSGPTPRRAGVSSFGFGGTNAHVIVEEAPPPLASAPARPYQLLLLSARSPSALDTMTANLYAALQRLPDSALADVAYTLQLGRRAFAYRRMLLVPSRQAALAALAPEARALLPTSHSAAQQPPLAFVFPGQGAQYLTMGRELYQTEPLFRETVDRCAELLKPHLGRDLRAVLYPEARQGDKETRRQGDSSADFSPSPVLPFSPSELEQTWLAQPALFVIEYALAQLWMAWGLQPAALLGHSLGEYVAATLAGVFTLDDALALVVARGQLMHACPAGAMLSVALSPEALTPWLEKTPRVELAAVNAPERCVVSGPRAQLEQLAQRLAAAGVDSQLLSTAQAFHSAQMEPMLAPFAERVRQVRLRAPRLRVVSSVTGEWLTAEQATDAGYWVRQVREPVQFAAGVGTLLAEGGMVVLEVGPGQTLSRLVRQHQASARARGVYASMPHARSEVGEQAQVLETLGQLWLAGVALDWAALHSDARRLRLPLPTYPFERQRFWMAPSSSSKPAGAADQSPEVRAPRSSWLYLPTWEQTLPPRPLEPTAIEATSRWMVFTKGHSLDNRLIDQLEGRNQQVIRIVPGPQFERHDPYTYTIDPERPGDYVTLLGELHAQGTPPDRIVYLWHGSLATGISTTASAPVQRQNTAGVVWLFQALARSDARTPVQVIVLSNDLQDVTGAERSAPEDVMMLGFCKVIGQELPSITCRSIDIQVPPADTAQESRLVAQILAEINADTSDAVVAYRGLRRWLPTFKPIDPTPGETGIRLRQDGVYMISGSLYPAGRVLAEHLLRTVQAKVVLLGRQDDQQRQSAALSGAIRPEHAGWLDQLRQQHDSRLLVLDVDTGDQAALSAAIAQVEQQLGSPHGLIHIPRMTNNQALYRPIVALQPTDLVHLSALLDELAALEWAFEGKIQDFCMLFSSTTSIVGGPACAVYAAGSHAIDRFAVQHSKITGTPWCSVNWDTWIDAEMNGHAAQNGAEHAMLTYQEALDAFQKAVPVTAAGQIVVSPAELNARVSHGLQWVGAAAQRVPDQETGLHAHPRPLLATPYVAPSNEVEQAIAEIWQHLLGIDQVGIHDNFFELGGDSLLATQVISRIRSAFYVNIEHRDLLTAPTIGELAQIIASMPRDQEKIEILEMLALLSDEEVDQEISKRMSLDEG